MPQELEISSDNMGCPPKSLNLLARLKVGVIEDFFNDYDSKFSDCSSKSILFIYYSDILAIQKHKSLQICILIQAMVQKTNNVYFFWYNSKVCLYNLLAMEGLSSSME